MQEKKERSAAKDFVSGILIVLFGIFIVVDALNMKIYNTFLDAPGFFPAIVGGVIIVLGGVATVRVLILILMMVVYIWGLLGRMHFIIATSIYLIANFLYLKAMKQWWISIIIAIAMSAIVYYAFKLGFNITMP